MDALATELQKPEYAGLSDWQVSSILNTPNDSFPVVVSPMPRLIGPGSIMEAVGPVDGANLLDRLEALAASIPTIKWAMTLVKGDGIDASSPSFRLQLDLLVAAGEMTLQQADAVKAMGESRRYPTWAEVNNVEVTPRSVGIARGGK